PQVVVSQGFVVGPRKVVHVRLRDVGAEGLLGCFEAGTYGTVVSPLDELGIGQTFFAKAPLDLFNLDFPNLSDSGVEFVGVPRAVSIEDPVQLLLDSTERARPNCVRRESLCQCDKSVDWSRTTLRQRLGW